jgi:hypothetical protein
MLPPPATAARLCLINGLEHGITVPLDTRQRLWPQGAGALDPWLSLLAALRLDVHAVLGHVLAIDWLDDQWSEPRPPAEDLRRLHGLEPHALTLWRPLADHLHEQLGAGRLVMLEADAWWLPDTDGQDYRRQHRRSPLIVNDFDATQRRLGYFHHDGYFHLQDEDFDGLMQAGLQGDGSLAPSATVIELRGLVRRPPETLRHLARQLLERHLERIPTRHPLRRWQRRSQAELDALVRQRDVEGCRRWLDCGIARLGASAELAAIHLRWLSGEDSGSAHLLQAADALRQLAVLARAAQLKAQRAVQQGQPVDLTALSERMARHWSRAMALLGAGAIVIEDLA